MNTFIVTKIVLELTFDFCSKYLHNYYMYSVNMYFNDKNIHLDQRRKDYLN